MITIDQAVACGDYMKRMDPWELVLPFRVARALDYFIHTHGSLHATLGLKRVMEEWDARDPDTMNTILAGCL